MFDQGTRITTCYEEGTYYTCIYCGSQKQGEDHVWYDTPRHSAIVYHVDHCYAKGTWYECTRCRVEGGSPYTWNSDDYEQYDTPKHKYNAGTLVDTCTEHGMLYTCVRCGAEEYGDDYIWYDEPSHHPEIVVYRDCYGEGTVEQCTKCGIRLDSDLVSYSEPKHEYYDDFTEEIDGCYVSFYKECRLCGDTSFERDEFQHTYGDPELFDNCFGKGSRQVCTKCGDEHTEFVETKSGAHDYGPEAPFADCFGEGVCRTCGICDNVNKEYTLVYDIAKHVMEAVPLSSYLDECDDCYIEERYCCAACGYISWGPIVARHTPSEPSCTAPQICTACGIQLNAATGHRYDDFQYTVEPKVGVGGYDIWKCVGCEGTIRKNPTDALPAPVGDDELLAALSPEQGEPPTGNVAGDQPAVELLPAYGAQGSALVVNRDAPEGADDMPLNVVLTDASLALCVEKDVEWIVISAEGCGIALPLAVASPCTISVGAPDAASEDAALDAYSLFGAPCEVSIDGAASAASGIVVRIAWIEGMSQTAVGLYVANGQVKTVEATLSRDANGAPAYFELPYQGNGVYRIAAATV